MKQNWLRIPLLILALMLTASLTLDAQFGPGSKRGKKRKKQDDSVAEYFDESGFKHRLWYGGGFNLGLSGNSVITFFGAGVSPMVGYKIIDPVSIGPRISFQYNHIKGIATDGRVRKVQPVSYSYGVFTRAKFLRMLFAHVEYEREHTTGVLTNQGLLEYDISTGKVATFRDVRDNLYVGAGYNSGFGTWGFEILALYNVFTPENTLESPFSIRFGVTYNF
jgi:hypothetical protein